MAQKSRYQRQSGIYCIRNSVTGMEYIGQSIDIRRRINDHFREAYNPRKYEYSSHLGRAIRKYGKESFVASTLILCEHERLDELEKAEISKHGTLFPKGYNFQPGGYCGMRDKPNDKMSKLSDAKLKKAKRLLSYTTIPQRAISKRLKVSQALISLINNGKIIDYSDPQESYPLRRVERKGQKPKPACARKDPFAGITEEDVMRAFRGNSCNKRKTAAALGVTNIAKCDPSGKIICVYDRLCDAARFSGDPHLYEYVHGKRSDPNGYSWKVYDGGARPEGFVGCDGSDRIYRGRKCDSWPEGVPSMGVYEFCCFVGNKKIYRRVRPKQDPSGRKYYDSEKYDEFLRCDACRKMAVAAD
jgi:group I intron endonuclease